MLVSATMTATATSNIYNYSEKLTLSCKMCKIKCKLLKIYIVSFYEMY